MGGNRSSVTGGPSQPVHVMNGLQMVDENGVAYGIAQVSNQVKVVSRPYLYAIAEGDIPDHTSFRRFGTNADVGVTNEIVAPVGGTYHWPTTASILHIASSDADDTGGDTGARTLWIQGLDANYDVISETVALTGASVVNTTKSFLRALQARVRTVGSTGANEGLITIKEATDTYTLLTIPIGEGRSNYAAWTVPNGYVAYMVAWHGSENSSKGCEFSLWFREYGYSWEKLRMVQTLDSGFDDIIQVPFQMSAKTDIVLQAKGLAAGANVAGGFVGWWESAT